jgi:hypothetical protein
MNAQTYRLLVLVREFDADHYQVGIHTDASALRGGVSVDNSALPGGVALPGELGRSDLPIETVRRLTCDGSLVTIVEDEDGTPLDVGRKRRTVTTALRRALWSRDRHCSFPGCHNRCYVDAHHIEHWVNGGETSLENLTLLCTFHHTLVHEGGFKIRHDRDGAIYFERPDGRVIPQFGYRLDDMRDEYAVAETPSTEVSAVREPAAVYDLSARRSGFSRDRVRPKSRYSFVGFGASPYTTAGSKTFSVVVNSSLIAPPLFAPSGTRR